MIRHQQCCFFIIFCRQNLCISVTKLSNNSNTYDFLLLHVMFSCCKHGILVSRATAARSASWPKSKYCDTCYDDRLPTLPARIN
jgi:hypothetical protein